MIRRFLLLAVLLLASSVISAQAQPPRRKLAVDDLAAIREVGSPQLSPDGAWILFTVSRPSLEDDKSHTHLWLAGYGGTGTANTKSSAEAAAGAALTGGSQDSLQLTFSDDSESSPRWSPDGKWIAFLSGRGSEEEIDQLWLMSREGGEGRKVTDFKGSVVDFDWAPGSDRMVLAVEDPDPEEVDSKTAGDKSESKKKKTPPPVVIDRLQFKQDKIGYLTTKRQHLYLLDLATKTSQPLTSGTFDEYLPSFSPDGTRIAFVSKRGEDPDRTDNTDIFIIETRAGAEPKQLTTFVGSDSDPENDTRPSWSPDGKTIAYIQGGPPELIYYGVRHLAVIPSSGGAARLVTPSLDRDVVHPQFSPDGRSIYFILEDDRNAVLSRVSAEGGTPETVVGGKRSISDFDAAKDHVVVLSADDLQPSEIFAAEKTPRQITFQNRDLLSQIDLGKVEEIEFASKDGTPIHGFVVHPSGTAEAAPLPAILRIHGGPTSQFEHRFSFEWQLLAANGYLVVAANPRGSTGRGQAFERAIWADWGNKDAQDVLAAVDHVVKRGMADPSRLGLGGWSYGGILTNYVITQDTRFKAATSGASIANILAGYGTDEYIREYEYELGRPWEHPEVWLHNSSPFLHADRIKTPTLFLAGDKDFNVPLLNSEQMYQALRSLGVPTRLIIYPGQYHGITKPSYQKDRYERYLAWYAKYLK
jgi:dipeptidyl aminopeptidase/acylaminoacyl peptidase